PAQQNQPAVAQQRAAVDDQAPRNQVVPAEGDTRPKGGRTQEPKPAPPPGHEAFGRDADGLPVNLQEAVALAERRVAIRQAGLKIAVAQLGVANAKVQLTRTQLAGARTSEQHSSVHLARIKELVDAKAVSMQEVEAARLRHESAKIATLEAENKLLVLEAEKAVEEARVDMARAELAESELRLAQLRKRLEKEPK